MCAHASVGFKDNGMRQKMTSLDELILSVFAEEKQEALSKREKISYIINNIDATDKKTKCTVGKLIKNSDEGQLKEIPRGLVVDMSVLSESTVNQIYNIVAYSIKDSK